MMDRLLVAIAFVLSCAGSSSAFAASESWHLGSLSYDSGVPLVGTVSLRAGYYKEAASVPFQGNILYLEGLGDSIVNHAPLFARLSDAGYRVIAFDYMGQGGSDGTMNHTRIYDPLFPALQISEIAKIVWDRYRRPDPDHGDRRIVMGWSTGGLAAYGMAHDGDADAVILLAPGIHTRTIIGDKMFITEATLTGAVFAKGQDPHLDPPSPSTPLAVPLFAANITQSAMLSQCWTVPGQVKGLVLLAGDGDRYVDNDATSESLSQNAPRFRQVRFPDSLHELDNERPEIRDGVYREILGFLSSL